MPKLARSDSVVVEKVTSDLKFEGSNPATIGTGMEKTAKERK
jgi:hypothetical protein